MKVNKQYTKEGFTLRLVQSDDIEPYYQDNYCPLNDDLVRFTGCKPSFSYSEIETFLLESIDSTSRFHFVLVDGSGRIVGESVLCDLDLSVRSIHYRLALFDEAQRGKGLGKFMVASALAYAFEELQLQRFDLEVFSYNTVAHSLYQSCGFTQEGVLRNSILFEGHYYDTYLFAMLVDEYKRYKEVL